ncbi:uncharacterized protein CG4449-like [Ctenocephalides felis]|uniref:uncharacterized protein CG4449-like n=1 Tax=Ctenocephalides felis TaxID=7515 RepID=UPI000E6E5444|nr:uncharacterized protein CG4449-like [Ctenocephalides felis]
MSDASDIENEFDFASQFKKAQAQIESNLKSSILDSSLDGPDLIPLKLDTDCKPITKETTTVEPVESHNNNYNEVISIESDSEDVKPELPNGRRCTRNSRYSRTSFDEGLFLQNGARTRNGTQRKRTRGARNKSQNKVQVANNRPAITVFSDSEGECNLSQLDKSQEIEEDLNYEQTVLIKWIFVKNYRVPLRRFQKLTFLQKELATFENVKADGIKLLLNGKELDPNECLHSLNITPKDIIDAIPVAEYCTSMTSTVSSTPSSNSLLKFKIQIKNEKRPLFVEIKPSDTFKVLFGKVSEEVGNVPLSKMRFKFDGDLLDAKKTADEQDLEGGECLDLEIIDR